MSEIEEIRDIWMEMQRHPNSDIDHYLSTIQTLPGVLRPHVMAVYRAGRPEAILVGRLDKRRVELRLGYRNVLSREVRSLTFIYGGVLGSLSTEGAELLARAILSALRRNEADLAFFNHLRTDSMLYSYVTSGLGFLSRDYFPTLQTHRAMSVPTTSAEFWRRFAPKVRKNQRWQAKKLITDHAGDVEIRCFQRTTELECMIQDVEQVAQKTYQRALGVGFADTEMTRRHLRLKAERGWLRGYVLYVAGSPRAFWLGTLYRETFHSDAMGYDPEYGKYSPGMYVIMHVIENFCNPQEESGISAIDFGLGDAQYKELLGNVDWEEASLYIFPPSLRGMAMNALRAPIVFIDQVAKRLLQKAELLQRVKTAWRHRVRGNGAS